MPAPIRLGTLTILLGGLLASGLRDGEAFSPNVPGVERGFQQVRGNTPYNGRFTFVRLRFDVKGFGGMGQAPWAHDYPRAEWNLMHIVSDFTLLAPRVDGGNILAVDDPDLFKFPFAYICEPGFWTQTEEQVELLRSWLLKGGFLVVDDFRGPDIENFHDELRRVLPGAELMPMDLDHPIFHSFFDIDSLEFTAPTYRRYPPVFYGVFENNDRNGRLLAVVNYNNDIGDFWEFSNTGWLPVEASNEAYKLGVNYVMYSMTH